MITPIQWVLLFPSLTVSVNNRPDPLEIGLGSSSRCRKWSRGERQRTPNSAHLCNLSDQFGKTLHLSLECPNMLSTIVSVSSLTYSLANVRVCCLLVTHTHEKMSSTRRYGDGWELTQGERERFRGTTRERKRELRLIEIFTRLIVKDISLGNSVYLYSAFHCLTAQVVSCALSRCVLSLSLQLRLPKWVCVFYSTHIFTNTSTPCPSCVHRKHPHDNQLHQLGALI